mmetsp:Transcript_6175/g.15348  ORF Transcript_6175/g.15348 Transcript_6175/m.15348 type:complete len:431 (-) Transcript_6175:1251-2543(-)
MAKAYALRMPQHTPPPIPHACQPFLPHQAMAAVAGNTVCCEGWRGTKHAQTTENTHRHTDRARTATRLSHRDTGQRRTEKGAHGQVGSRLHTLQRVPSTSHHPHPRPKPCSECEPAAHSPACITFPTPKLMASCAQLRPRRAAHASRQSGSRRRALTGHTCEQSEMASSASQLWHSPCTPSLPPANSLGLSTAGGCSVGLTTPRPNPLQQPPGPLNPAGPHPLRTRGKITAHHLAAPGGTPAPAWRSRVSQPHQSLRSTSGQLHIQAYTGAAPSYIGEHLKTLVSIIASSSQAKGCTCRSTKTPSSPKQPNRHTSHQQLSAFPGPATTPGHVIFCCRALPLFTSWVGAAHRRAPPSCSAHRTRCTASWGPPGPRAIRGWSGCRTRCSRGRAGVARGARTCCRGRPQRACGCCAAAAWRPARPAPAAPRAG